MLDSAEFDPAAYVDQMAIALNLPIAPEYRPGVMDNFSRIRAIAQLVLEFSLPEDVVAAPVFQPFQP
ncbi:MAG: DUF4089 domain-containing protein [Leptolyngbyaceae cyanobacterium RM2_2_4]|nr:DUF4089 domain-containing protein [Leptolyngbyaceae cyanobacterium SM1_4_3]NJN90780.1 DUF4089 domain-containing protein [Leptolyngbyaceae cyanobacterium SL_5_14]NJO50345.1 DUF4089 domain-containing protein [Leptolyngbyaceae cyanobacterium RM2_2_4]NJO66963.1 DUF4089 domain-containing protein [Leptolyngbyaceae cyanobacterium RM1_405_57]